MNKTQYTITEKEDELQENLLNLSNSIDANKYKKVNGNLSSFLIDELLNQTAELIDYQRTQAKIVFDEIEKIYPFETNMENKSRLNLIESVSRHIGTNRIDNGDGWRSRLD